MTSHDNHSSHCLNNWEWFFYIYYYISGYYHTKFQVFSISHPGDITCGPTRPSALRFSKKLSPDRALSKTCLSDEDQLVEVGYTFSERKAFW